MFAYGLSPPALLAGPLSWVPSPPLLSRPTWAAWGGEGIGGGTYYFTWANGGEGEGKQLRLESSPPVRGSPPSGPKCPKGLKERNKLLKPYTYV